MGWTLIGSGNQTILLLAGAIGVGKSSVTELLSAQHGFERISSGGYLTRVLERNGSKATRSSLVELGDQLDRDTDFEWVVRDVVEEALASQPDYLL
jgi:dephospho-CoA kinase